MCIRDRVEGVQAVILVPSRELALQIEQVFKSMNTGFTIMSCYGGRPAMDEHRTMKGIRPSVIVGTPGRMNDHLEKLNFDAAVVNLLVIDEFDKCLEFGFQEEMAAVIGKLPNLRRRFLLSATDTEEIPRFTQRNAATDEILILIVAYQPDNSHTAYGFRHTHYRQDCSLRQ